MKPTNALNAPIQRKFPVAVALAAFVVGVAGTAAVMSRRGSTPTVNHAQGPVEKVADSAPTETGGGEHGLIKLSPEAVQTAGIRVEAARLAPVGDSLTVPGTVEVSPNRGAKITPPAPGKIVRLLAGPGDAVRAGQALAALDSYDVAQAHAAVRQAESGVKQAQSGLQTAQAEVAQARAGVAQAQAELQQARTKQRSAETALERQKELAAAGTFSQPTLQAAQSELSDAQSDLLKAQTELQSHSAALQRAERLFKEELISRSELEQAQLEQRQDQTVQERAQARVAQAKQTLEREQKVFRGDLLTRQQVQTAEAEVRAAQGDVLKALQGVSRAQQDVRRAEKGVQAARTALHGAEAGLEAARTNLYALEGSGHAAGGGGLLTIPAPIGGTVTDRQATLGEAVERTTVLFVIENLNSVTVQAAVPEQDVARVRIGQPVEVTVAAYPRMRFPGVVQSVGGRVDQKTRALPVHCLVENRDGRLRPEMFAKVSLSVGSRTNALAVPISALDEDGAERYVYVQQKDGFERRKVEVGRKSGASVEIVRGISAGDRVVVEGAFVLKSESKKSELKGEE